MKRRDGMTLLELMVSSGLLVVVAGLAYGAFAGMFEAQRRLEERQRLLALCRNQLVETTRQLGSLAVAYRLFPEPGQSRLAFSGEPDRIRFHSAGLDGPGHLAERELAPRAPGVTVVFSYHPRGAPTETWEASWLNREDLPGRIRITATAGEAEGDGERVELSTTVVVRCAP